MTTDVHTQTDVTMDLLPDGGFIRQAQVLRSIPVSRSTLWRWVRAGDFPAPVKLSVQVSAWRVSDVRQWMSERSQAGRRGV